MSEYRTELEFARNVAILGGRVAMGHFRKQPHSELKADGSIVTEADWAAEAQIRLRIARTFPDHNIYGEEEGLTGAGGGPPTDGAPTWVIDPIDGTSNYAAGIPIWATLIALRVDDRSVVGVAHAPALGETYEAALGSGAKMNGEPIEVDPATDLSDAMVLSSGLEWLIAHDLQAFYTELISRSARSRGLGDFWGHALVARGAAHIMIDPVVMLWDFAPLEVIVSEAGGRISQLNGDPCVHGESCLSTNGALHEETLALVKPHLGSE
jgi:histidinol-phosphatase